MSSAQPIPAPVRDALSHTRPRDVLSDITVVALPMVTRFRGITVREAMLMRGPAGWAEFSPFVEYGVEEASRWLAAGLEQALCPAPAPLRTAVPVNGTVPACDPAEVPRLIERYDGVGTFKIKIAESGISSLQEDLSRIDAVRAAAPRAALRLDANAGYTVEQAVQALQAFSRFDLQYVEQPTAAVEDLARLREIVDAQQLGIRIAADESIRRAEDPLRVAQLGAADVIIVKAAPLGGMRRTLDVVARSGLPAVVSSALDTSVGLSAGAMLAAALPEHPAERAIFGGAPACGLGTSSLFHRDVSDPPLRAAAGAIAAAPAVPSADALKALQAEPQRTAWWEQRLLDCWDALRGDLLSS